MNKYFRKARTIVNRSFSATAILCFAAITTQAFAQSPPVQLVAVQGARVSTETTQRVHLSWTPANSGATVAVVRNTGGYATTVAGGTEVYRGTATTYTDSGLSAATYYYSAFEIASGGTSAATNAGAAGTVVSNNWRPSYLDPNSDYGIGCASLTDADRDGTFLWNETAAGKLALSLKGRARPGERDRIELCLSKPVDEKLWSMEIDVTMPSSVSHNESLVIYPFGTGAAETLIYRNRWKLKINSSYSYLPDTIKFQANTTYKLAWVVNGLTGRVTFYINGTYIYERNHAFTKVERIRIENYGSSSTADLEYTMDNINIRKVWPSYHQRSAAWANAARYPGPASVFALGAPSSAIISWVSEPGASNSSVIPVRVVRKTGSYSTGPSDGVVVYEGTNDTATDQGGVFGTAPPSGGLAVGTYFYSVYWKVGDTYSAGVNAGTQGTQVTSHGGAAFMHSQSDHTLSCLKSLDPNPVRNETFAPDEKGGALELLLRGRARPGERDRIEVCLNTPMTGLSAIEVDVTMPASVSHNESLVLYPYDSSSSAAAETLIYRNRWKLKINSSYSYLPATIPFVAGRKYKLAWVTNGVTGRVTFYIDGTYIYERDHGFYQFDRFRIENYGSSSTADLIYKIENLRFRDTWPLYHKRNAAWTTARYPQPAHVFAIGTPTGAALSWINEPGNATRGGNPIPVRVVRNATAYPAHATDGDIVYEGSGGTTQDDHYEDTVSPGRYYYSIFWHVNGTFSAPRAFGTEGTVVSADGRSPILSAESHHKFLCVSSSDPNPVRNETFMPDEKGGALDMLLRGRANPGERDRIDLCLTPVMSGLTTLEMDVTMPSSVSHNESLVIYPYGTGAAETLIYRNRWKLKINSSYSYLPDTIKFQANTTYKLSWVINGVTGRVTFYINGTYIFMSGIMAFTV